MTNIQGVSTGRVTKPNGKGRYKSAFQGSGRRIDGSIVEPRKKVVDMEDDYEKLKLDIEEEIETEDDDDWSGEAAKKVKKNIELKENKESRVLKPKDESKIAPSQKTVAESMVAEAEQVDKQIEPQTYKEMEIVDRSGNIEVVRRINLEKESARFALLVLPAEEKVSSAADDEQYVSTMRIIIPCANGIFIRYDPSNKMRLHEMSKVEVQERGQKNPCSCDACEEAEEEARKEAEKEEKHERDKMELGMMAAKATRSGKSFNTQGRVLGD